MWFTLAFPTLVFLFLHSLIALIRTSGKMLKIGDVKRHVWIILYMRGNIKKTFQHQFWYFCCCSVAQSCPPLCDPMDCSMPGLPVLHQLPEFAQAHVQWVSDAIQPSHPLSLRPPPALNLSQHQGLSNELTLHNRWPKYWSFSFLISLPMNIQDWLPLGLTGLISLLPKGLFFFFL